MKSSCIFSILSIFLSIHQLRSQNNTIAYTKDNLIEHFVIKQNGYTGRVTDADVSGSPYLKDSFENCMVYTTKVTYQDIPMRYNIFEDYMEFVGKTGTLILDPKIEIKKIELNDQSFTVQPFDDRGKIRLGYFFLIDSGAVLLLKKKNIRFQERILARALESKSTPPQYLPLPDTYYYRLPGQLAKPVISIKKMIEDLPDHKDEMLAFTKNLKLKVNPSDLSTLIQQYHLFSLKK